MAEIFYQISKNSLFGRIKTLCLFFPNLFDIILKSKIFSGSNMILEVIQRDILCLIPHLRTNEWFLGRHSEIDFFHCIRSSSRHRISYTDEHKLMFYAIFMIMNPFYSHPSTPEMTEAIFLATFTSCFVAYKMVHSRMYELNPTSSFVPKIQVSFQ